MCAARRRCRIKVVDGTISGEIAGVPYAHVAGRHPHPSGGELYLLEPSAVGRHGPAGIATTREIHGELLLDGAGHADRFAGRRVVGGPAADRAGRHLRRAVRRRAAADRRLHLAAAAVREAALDLPGRALKAADAYVDAGGSTRPCCRRPGGSTRLSELGTTPDEASAYVLTAAWWAAEAGQHCVHITQHLHGGMGADITYPIHRYFLWGKSIELYVGGASRAAREAGRRHRDPRQPG